MSQVTLSCQCGTVLSIPGAKPGDQVRCVKCGRSSIVRNEEDPSTAQTRTEDWIKFTCTCGKSVKAPKSWAGEIAKCPRCKRKTRLPGGDHGRRDRNDPLAVFYDPKEADRDVLRLSQLGNQKPTNQSGETSILPSPVAPAPAAATPNSPTASIADELDAALSDGGASRNEGTMFMEAVTEHDQDPSSLAESTGTLDPILRATCACGKVVKAPLTLAGKTGRCPRCRRDVAMPANPQRKSKDPFVDDALDAGPINERSGTIIGFDALTDNEPGPAPATEVPTAHPAGASGPALDSSRKIDKSDSTADSAELLESFLRIACPCGKAVKAPLALAGKIGRCPKCGREVVMPLVPAKKSRRSLPQGEHGIEPENQLSATALGFDAITHAPPTPRHDGIPEAPRTESGPGKPVVESKPEPAESNPVVASPQVAVHADSPAAQPSAAGSSGEPDQNNQSVPSDQVVRSPGQTSRQLEIKRRTALYTKFRNRERVSLNDILWTLATLPKTLSQSGANMPPAVAAGISVVALAVAIAVFVHSVPNDYVQAQQMMPTPRNYYYDMTSGQILELSEVEYADRANQAIKSDPEKEFRLARAYVFACGSCDPSTRKIVFLERVTAEALRAQRELQELLQKGEHGDTHTAALAGIITGGDLVARLTTPKAEKSKTIPSPAAATPVSAAATTAPTTSPAASQPSIQSAAAPTSQPSTNVSVKEFIDRLQWVKYEDAKGTIMMSPLPDCMKNANLCSPESR